MINFELPFINLPSEFVKLLKTGIILGDSPAQVFDVIRPNPALYATLQTSFKEFDDGRGIEKLLLALGWPNFRERMASLFIHKAKYGNYPVKSDLELVENLRQLETRFVDQSIYAYSRVFLLGFYMEMANLHLKDKNSRRTLLSVLPEVEDAVKFSPARSEKLDWIIIITMHFNDALGRNILMNALSQGKTFNQIFDMLNLESKSILHKNLLAYAGSIQDPEVFYYEKI